MLFGQTNVPCRERQPGIIVHQLHRSRRRTTRKRKVHKAYSEPLTDETRGCFKPRVFYRDRTSQEQSIFHCNLLIRILGEFFRGALFCVKKGSPNPSQKTLEVVSKILL